MSNNNKWTAEQMPDLKGRIAVVTGANSGLGFEVARALAGKGAEVIMACRSQERGEQAARDIRENVPGAQLSHWSLDLADLFSVRAFAAGFRDKYSKLDLLFNNAGIMAVPYGKTKDGFESQIGTNHFGHFVLTGLLLDLMRDTPHSRVITTSSYAHHIGRINFADLNRERFYQKWLAYGQSKLANVLFGYELNRRLSQNGGNPISVVAHPGYAATNLQHTTRLFSLLNPLMAQSQEMGSLPLLYAGTHEDIKGGEYIGPDGFLAQRGYPKRARSSRRSYDRELAARLWDVSEQQTGMRYEF
ncbi:MAG: SDR family NAD(P)-dependent oxidoreductase [Anaerolineales bacterium]|nr:SDR family NAD(P)-dependent oxidoreductase [Anaerolineales bacterium]